MKKGVVLLFALALFACNSKSKEEVVDDAILQGTDTVAIVEDGHNAQNSLDYQGVYQGVLPTASGEGVDVAVELFDTTYVKTSVYVGVKREPVITKGAYSWNKAGNTITLENEEKPNQYFVGENRLIQLDVDGKRITGEIEEDYILRK